MYHMLEKMKEKGWEQDGILIINAGMQQMNHMKNLKMFRNTYGIHLSNVGKQLIWML